MTGRALEPATDQRVQRMACIPVPPRESWVFIEAGSEIPAGYMGIGLVEVSLCDRLAPRALPSVEQSDAPEVCERCPYARNER